MNKVSIGDFLPDLTFESTNPHLHSFKDLLGHNVVLYFYPKDNTPGCTLESKNFSALQAEFAKANAQIIGISRDTLSCHQKFVSKLALPFTLIADKDETLCRFFNVMIEKNIFLRKLIGIHRSTFLADEKGKIIHIWRKVKVKDHAAQVLETLLKHNKQFN